MSGPPDPPTTDVARPEELLNPVTGVLVPVGDIAAVADALVDLREMESAVKRARAAFSSIIIEESQRAGMRTITAGGYELKVSAPDELEWDMQALDALRDAGLPESRFDELVVATVTYKVNGTVARQLSAASPTYKAIIEGAKLRVPKRQYVSL